MTGEIYGPSWSPLTPEQKAANETAELQAALPATLEIYGLPTDASWVDVARESAAPAEEERLREAAPRLGLEPDAPLETIREADRQATAARIADLKAQFPPKNLELTPGRAAHQEQLRLELIEQLGLPSDTSVEDATAARICAEEAAKRQQLAKFLRLSPMASLEEIAQAEAELEESYREARERHGGGFKTDISRLTA